MRDDASWPRASMVLLADHGATVTAAPEFVERLSNGHPCHARHPRTVLGCELTIVRSPSYCGATNAARIRGFPG